MGDGLELLVAVVASGALTAVVTSLLRRRSDQVDYLRDIAAELRTELTRLQTQVDELHALVVALETEIVTLGGDPLRVRQQIKRNQGTTNGES